MKKILSLLLLLALALTLLASCAPTDSTKITVGVMNGPTGMGMAKLMNDSGSESELYAFKTFADPTVGVSELIAGKLDMLCLPTHTAATLATKNEDFITVIAVNTLGSLYLVTDEENSVTDIKELAGKTIYTSVAGSTTKPIVEYLLQQNGITANIVVEKDHDTLVTLVKSGQAPIAVLPEPKVTAGFMNDTNYKVRLNLSEEWSKVSETDLTMGCIVVRNDFLREHTGAVDRFLVDYKASVDYIANRNNLESSASLIVSAGILPKLPVAKGALQNLYGSIVYVDGTDMKLALTGFYTAINQALPSDDFYYEK